MTTSPTTNPASAASPAPGETPAEAAAPAAPPGGNAVPTVALLLVLALAVGSLVYVTLAYFRVEHQLSEAQTRLERAENEVTNIAKELAGAEARQLHEADQDEAGRQPSEGAPQAVLEEFYAAWEQVAEVGMPPHHFLRKLHEESLWPVYGTLRRLDEESVRREANLATRERKWLGLISARLGLADAARRHLENVVATEPSHWTYWLDAAELFAAWHDEQALAAAFAAATDAAPTEQREHVEAERQRLHRQMREHAEEE